MNRIESIESLEEQIDHTESPNIFLGNGFNMCLGVDTSYCSLWESLSEQRNISDILNEYPEFLQNVIKNNCNIESCLDEIKNRGHHSTLQTELYRNILSKCRTKYRYNETISFFLKFKKFFTTNYDPLLYRFLLQPKKASVDENESFYTDLKAIHDGNISDISICEEVIPLRAITKKQVYELALKIFKDRELHKEKKRDEYYDVLKKLRNEPVIEINDGFFISQPATEKNKKKYKRWDKSRSQEQNIYYLHGALHIYREDAHIQKMILQKGHHDKKFINEILEIASNSSCVFEKEYASKLAKIQNNPYLRFCLDSLKQESGSLFIIGWSCNENDQHLIDAINSSELSHLYVSLYSDRDSSRYEEVFPKKKLTFFKSNILPFAKKAVEKNLPSLGPLEK